MQILGLGLQPCLPIMQEMGKCQQSPGPSLQKSSQHMKQEAYDCVQVGTEHTCSICSRCWISKRGCQSCDDLVICGCWASSLECPWDSVVEGQEAEGNSDSIHAQKLHAVYNGSKILGLTVRAALQRTSPKVRAWTAGQPYCNISLRGAQESVAIAVWCMSLQIDRSVHHK